MPPVRRTSLAAPVLEVAPALLGMVLRRTTPEGVVAVRITEVEAYDGPNDPGSHSYRGQTPRNAVMFGPPGHLYVYFTYGMHYCMNIAVGPPNQPSAVLFRAGEIIEGTPLARQRRGFTTAPAFPLGSEAAEPRARPRAAKVHPDRDLARGPARLCVALGIDRADNGVDLLNRGSAIQLLPGDGYDGEVATGPRVGLREAADWPWRFWIPGDPTVSPYKPHVPKKRS
ncbi:DNA-3-methyladenine glycosylase [Kribbella ginsengisoli]|uniref:DNA-3-methyladenine glycosylase n=1 Tax=Kribbella ginsengisoli TaxID=363865 RepID=UPI0031D89C41